MDSPKAWQSTVGHEVTHVLEGTELYTELQTALFDYAKSKGEYDSRLANLTELYKGVKDANVEAELTADLVGDYLFQDSDFINNLSTKHRNVFQKIYEEIKYLLKISTGTKEARELEKAKRAFENAYRQTSDVKTDAENTKYSVENRSKRKYNKRSKYSEAETLFLSWENGSAPVGEVKRFNRYGKIRYYEKTENGCIELSMSQYNERKGIDVEKSYRRAASEISKTNDYDGSTPRGLYGDPNGHRDTSGIATVFGQTFREELSDDTTGSESSTVGYDIRNGINQTEYNEEVSGDPGASFITFSNDYAAIRNFMKDGNPDNKDIRYSISNEDEQGKRYGNFYTPATELRLQEDVAPVPEATEETETAPITEPVADMFPDDLPPVQTELDKLNQERASLESRMLELVNNGDYDTFAEVNTEYEQVMSRIEVLDKEIAESEADRVASLDDADVPPVTETQYPGESQEQIAEDPFVLWPCYYLLRQWQQNKQARIVCILYQ